MIKQAAPLIAGFSDKRDVVVLILGASRRDGEHITDGQVGSALNTAKSVLQMVGADVDASSSAFLLSDDDFAEGDALTAKTTVELWKNLSDASNESEQSGNEDLGLGEVDETE